MKKKASAYPAVYLYRRIVRAKLFIDQHYYQPINLNDIAHEAYFSKYHFIRLFKEAYGQTPHQYLMTQRIEKAKVLLSQEHIPVATICFEVGFESVGSFSSLFKRRTGITPQVYRRQERRKRKLMQKQPLHYVPGCFASVSGWTP